MSQPRRVSRYPPRLAYAAVRGGVYRCVPWGMVFVQGMRMGMCIESEAAEMARVDDLCASTSRQREREGAGEGV